ncbi:hypothetical protein AOLI_G00330930, partial [Acnodon oligacanthus]
ENVEREMRAETRLKRVKDLEVKRRPTPSAPRVLWGTLGASVDHGNSSVMATLTILGSDTHTVPHSPEMTIQVETHTLVPALQAFSFDPLPDRHHGNTPTQEHDLQEHNQVSLSLTGVNPEIESSVGCEEPQNPVEKPSATTAGSEMDVKPKQSEKPDEEEHNSACGNSSPVSPTAFHTDQSAINSTRDSTESSNEAPGSYITTSTEGEEKPLRHSVSPEDRRLPSKISGRAPKTMSSSKPALFLSKSSSSKPSSSTKTRPLHPVRTLTPSETQSMRKVIPLSRNPQASRASAVHVPSSTPPAQRASKSSMKKASMQRSSVKKAVVQQKSPPEEKMCRSTLRALAQAGGNVHPPTQQNSTHSHAPHFAQGTVASATRSAAVTPGNLPVKHGTVATTSKGPSLNRATSLRLAQSGVTSPSKVIFPSMSTRAKSVRLTPSAPSAGHVKKNIVSPFDKSAFSQDSLDKPHRPAWR